MSQTVSIEFPPLPDGADSWNVYVPQMSCDHSVYYNLFEKTVTASHEGKYFDIKSPEDRKRFNRRLYEHRCFQRANRLLNRAECEL
jgi:hypothetical protein